MIADLDCLISPSGEERITDYITTLWYRAPEILAYNLASDDPKTPKTFTNKVDIWALGLILYQLYTGKYLVTGDDETDTADRLEHTLSKRTYPSNKRRYKKIPEKVKELMFEMLTVKPEKRIEIENVLTHPLLKKYTCRVHENLFHKIRPLYLEKQEENGEKP